MAFNIAEFKANLTGDGARPNLFSVTMALPTIVANGSAAGQKITFMAKTAQLPGSTIGTVPLQYFGREVKFVGNRTFADWTLTIINDEDFLIRNAIENWMDSLNSNSQNIRSAAVVNATQYATDAKVTQYGKAGNDIKDYTFVGMFPIDLAPIDLDWGSNDTIEEYSVTFAYQYWESNSTT
jgi:T4-like virus tail tube protein gp19